MIFRLELTPQEMQYLSNVLGERPFKEVAELIQKINAQIIQQQQPPPQLPLKGNGADVKVN